MPYRTRTLVQISSSVLSWQAVFLFFCCNDQKIFSFYRRWPEEWRSIRHLWSMTKLLVGVIQCQQLLVLSVTTLADNNLPIALDPSVGLEVVLFRQSYPND